VTTIATTARSGVGTLLDRSRQGVITGGELVVLAVESVKFAVAEIVARRFSWTEFLRQAWFMTRVSLLPTILVAIPFGVIISVQIGAVAGQIGATSFQGAVNGLGAVGSWTSSRSPTCSLPRARGDGG
jgi:phospholipid/cholesterol/gamma-HCH transport system permease protein